MPNTKVVANIQIYLHKKFHIFMRFLGISFQFILTCMKNQIETRIEIGKRGSRAVFLSPAQRYSAPAQSSA
jgi:hypothetical protein